MPGCLDGLVRLRAFVFLLALLDILIPMFSSPRAPRDNTVQFSCVGILSGLGTRGW